MVQLMTAFWISCGAGLSASKMRSLRDLAEKIHSGAVPIKRLSELTDEEVIECLLPVRGIGRWTAEMFLIFSLGRHDVLPVADWGLRVAAQKQYALAEPPGKAELVELAEPWRPLHRLSLLRCQRLQAISCRDGLRRPD